MNQLALNHTAKNHVPTCGDLMTMAEQELAAFFSAVTELFGSEQAQLSAEDWLHELLAISINDLPASTREWRLLTVKVSARLASRLNRRRSRSSVAKRSRIGDIRSPNSLELGNPHSHLILVKPDGRSTMDV
jgi:hypothetical protein